MALWWGFKYHFSGGARNWCDLRYPSRTLVQRISTESRRRLGDNRPTHPSPPGNEDFQVQAFVIGGGLDLMGPIYPDEDFKNLDGDFEVN